MKFYVIDGCPCPASIAPFVYLVLREAGQTASSIYRGSEPRAVKILHAHGKHTQAELHAMPEYAEISNPPNESEHELRSDGEANAGPVGRVLHEWEQGVDSGGNDELSKSHIVKGADRYRWKVRHPYSRGVEGHHWCFAEKPKAHSLKTKAKILKLRATLPRK